MAGKSACIMSFSMWQKPMANSTAKVVFWTAWRVAVVSVIVEGKMPWSHEFCHPRACKAAPHGTGDLRIRR